MANIIQNNDMSDDLINPNQYMIIMGWMMIKPERGGMGLCGKELDIFAIIHSYSNTCGQLFTGSLEYIAQWTQCTKRHVMRCIQLLLDKKYIIKYEKTMHNIKYCAYKTSKCADAEEIDGYKRVGVEITTTSINTGSDLRSQGMTSGHHPDDLRSPNNIVYNIDNTSSYTNVYSEVGCERAPAVPAEPAGPIKDTTASGATPLFTRQRKKSSAQFLIEKERAKGAQTSNEEKERTCAGVGVQARRQAGTREAVAAVAAPNERGASRETAMRNNLAKRFVEYCGAKWQRDLMSDKLKEFGQKLFDWIYSCAHTYKFKMDEPVAKSLWAELDRYKQQYGVDTLMKVLQKATSQATRIYPTMFYEFTSSNSTRRERRFNDEDTTTQQITPDTKTSNIY